MSKETDSWSNGGIQPAARRRSRGWLGWLLFLLLTAGAAAFVWYVHLPLRARRADLERQRQEQAAQIARSKQKLRDSETELGELKRKQDELSGQLVQTVAEKEKIEAELKRVQSDLSAKLEPEIQAGNVRIRRRGNDLVVDLADQILFDSGKTEINEGGQKVLGQVAPTLAQLKEYTIQVAGHTDSARVVSPETQEHFATNWELSSARASNVVRFLQEKGRVPGERLVAMGFAQYRPQSNNNTAEGRQKNRRIELILQRN
ncbi:MAG TPA: OmpA family protein [Polyangiaceae bacterium]|jgi:chemotaxis protein MotB|nr:OmpA family protein [Polyangiaceae bacterium]